jgi:hypothetical protein
MQVSLVIVISVVWIPFMSLSIIAKSDYMLHHVCLSPSVCLSDFMEQLSSHWTDFLEIK